MVKSIRLLLLIAVIQISFSSCLLWKESFLSLKQTNAYFLILIVGIFCSLCWDKLFPYSRPV